MTQNTNHQGWKCASNVTSQLSCNTYLEKIKSNYTLESYGNENKFQIFKH